MSTYTASLDVFDRVGTTTGITLSTGAYTGTNSTVLTFATTSAEQRADHTYTYGDATDANFIPLIAETVFFTKCATGVSTTNWREWCATSANNLSLTSQMPTVSDGYTYTRIKYESTTGPWIYQSRVEQTITRSRDFTYDYQMYSTTEDSLGDPIFKFWYPYPNSSTQTETQSVGGGFIYIPGTVIEITSTQHFWQTETIAETLAPLADTKKNYYSAGRTATVWYTKSNRDLFGQSIDAGIGTTTTRILTQIVISEDAADNLLPSFITMGFGYTEWARSFEGYAPAGAGTRSSEYGALTSHAGVLDLWPFEQWDTYWYSEQESYYSLPGVAMVAPGVLALPPWCAVSSSIAGVGSVSALVDGENISYTTASSTEITAGTVTFVSIESSSFTYKIQKMGEPVTYYQGYDASRVNPNDLGVADFGGLHYETTRFYEKRGSEIFKDHMQLIESFDPNGAHYNPGGQYYLLSNNPYYLSPRVVQAPAKNMAFAETVALWGCFDTATGTDPATTIYREYTTFLKSSYARFRPIVLASLA